jgi:uncharacterized protein Usg
LDGKLGPSRTGDSHDLARFSEAGEGLRSDHGTHPISAQTYVWQAYDLCPEFPELQGFLEFWQKSLEGVLHSVTVAHSRLIKPAEIKPVDGLFRLH